ncbi:MAG: hypothetical protein ABFC34_04905 [Methanobacterium sp.]
MRKGKKDIGTNEKKLEEELEKKLSPARAVFRIILGIFGLLLWILIGVNPTILFSSTIQQFMGVTSFFYRNPIVFLMVALINIFLGIIVYFIGIIWWSAFHVIWSIRWFYGYAKYRNVGEAPN